MRDDGEGGDLESAVKDDPAREPVPNRAALTLCELYDSALPEVYGYLLHGAGRPSVAEDLTSETFLAAVDAVQRDRVPDLTVAWLIGVARHKLVDHWRRQEREEAKLALAADADADADAIDEWDVQLDAIRAHDVLAAWRRTTGSRSTLRYLDGLPVPEVATCSTAPSTPPRRCSCAPGSAFRRAYGEEDPVPDPSSSCSRPVEPWSPAASFRRALRRRIHARSASTPLMPVTVDLPRGAPP